VAHESIFDHGATIASGEGDSGPVGGEVSGTSNVKGRHNRGIKLSTVYCCIVDAGDRTAQTICRGISGAWGGHRWRVASCENVQIIFTVAIRDVC
jgi:hypothetical protein